jgi:hypothetical protein
VACSSLLEHGEFYLTDNSPTKIAPGGNRGYEYEYASIDCYPTTDGGGYALVINDP